MEKIEAPPKLKGSDIQKEVRDLDLGSKVRRLRQRRGLTLQNVSDMSGLSKPLLSQIENNIAAPPIATLIKISKALGVKIGHFFHAADIEERIVVVRRGERFGPVSRSHHETLDTGYHYASLAYPMTRKHMDPFLVKIEPRDEQQLLLFNHRGEEFLFMLEGRVEFRSSERAITLVKGDSIYFDAGIPHALRSLEDKKAEALVVIYDM